MEDETTPATPAIQPATDADDADEAVVADAGDPLTPPTGAAATTVPSEVAPAEDRGAPVPDDAVPPDDSLDVAELASDGGGAGGDSTAPAEGRAAVARRVEVRQGQVRQGEVVTRRGDRGGRLAVARRGMSVERIRRVASHPAVVASTAALTTVAVRAGFEAVRRSAVRQVTGEVARQLAQQGAAPSGAVTGGPVAVPTAVVVRVLLVVHEHVRTGVIENPYRRDF